MDIAQLRQSLGHDAALVVFVNVLLQQIGLPVPAVPTLLVAGSLVAGADGLAVLLLAATLASVFADGLWYAAGQRFGYRVLAGLCRLSINPASCVSQTESRFVRWGLPSLVVAKFVPGFSTVAPPIAGALRMPVGGFVLAAGIGAALWAGLALGAGWLLKDTVAVAIDWLDAHTARAVGMVGSALALWLSWKLWQKQRFRRLRVPEIGIDELLALRKADAPLRLLDLRGALMVAETGPIPGATLADYDRLFEAVGDWPRDGLIVTLCACPEDAGAIQAARQLIHAGYLSVKPLAGGYDAWLAAQAVPQ